MAYAGGKAKLANKIAECVKQHAQDRRIVEPFCGSLAVTAKLGNVAIASDICEPLINMYKAVRAGWVPPDYVSRETYNAVKTTQDPDDPMTAFVGFWHSFGGKWFAGYKPYYPGSHVPGGAARVVLRDVKRCANTELLCCSYVDVVLGSGDLAYLDPPYAGTIDVGLRYGFDHASFWDWCRQQETNGAVVLVSEQSAPPDFVSVLSLRPNTRLGKNAEYREEHVYRWQGAIA